MSVLSLLVVLMAVGIGPKIFFKTSDWLTSKVSRVFLLEDIEWQQVGESNLSELVTQELLWQTSGLQKGAEVLRVKLSEIEERLLSIPWLESVQIQKKIPSSLLVQYTVQQARALLIAKNEIFFLSSEGKIIAPAIETRPLPASDLPIIIASKKDSSEVSIALAWLDAIEKSSRLVHEVRVASDRVVLLTEIPYLSKSRKVELWLKKNGTDDVIFRLNRVAQYLIKNNILVSTIDLRPAKKVVVNVGKRS